MLSDKTTTKAMDYLQQSAKLPQTSCIQFIVKLHIFQIKKSLTHDQMKHHAVVVNTRFSHLRDFYFCEKFDLIIQNSEPLSVQIRLEDGVEV